MWSVFCRFLAGFVGMLSISIAALAAPKSEHEVVVAVIDGNSDLTHPMIAQYLFAGQKEEFPGSADPLLRELFEDNRRLKSAVEQRYQEMLSAKDEGAPYLLSSLSHGTHTDSLATFNLDPRRVKLIHIPVPSFMVPGLKDYKLDSGPELATQLNRWTDRVSRILKDYRVKAVNFSLGGGTTPFDASKDALQRMILLFNPELEVNGEPLAQILNRRIRGEELLEWSMRMLFAKNPETQFFMAAANDGVDIETMPVGQWSQIQIPNLFKVGAVDSKELLADFSNFSPTLVDMAALGVEISGAVPEGGIEKKAGTSMAAPLAVRSYIQGFFERPEMTREEAVAYFFDHRTRVNHPGLNGKIKDGRLVRTCPEVFSEL